MKTSDIIPGVVYAHSTREDGYYQPAIVVDIETPVRILDSSYAGREARRLVTDAHSAPAARTFAAVMLAQSIVDTEHAAPLVDNAEAIGAKTLEDVLGQNVEQERGLPDGTSIEAIRPRDIRCTWDEFVAAKRQEADASRERRAREEAARTLNTRNGDLLRGALARRGVEAARWDGPARINTERGSVTVDFAVLADLLGVTLEA